MFLKGYSIEVKRITQIHTMTPEEKEIFNKELCCLIPYKVEIDDGTLGFNFKLSYRTGPITLDVKSCSYFNHQLKPILRPLSQLTEKITHNGETFVPVEKIKSFLPYEPWFGFGIERDDTGVIGFRTPESWLPLTNWPQMFDKLREWHFWIGPQDFFEKGYLIEREVEG